MPYMDPAKQAEYQRRWLARRRDEWFEGKVCIDCGSAEQLELDHVEAKTKISHRVWSWSKTRREAELAKCVIRCRSCHTKKGFAQGDQLQGESHPDSKLTEVQVREIRSRYAAGESSTSMAEEYSVNFRTIWKVATRKSWRHVK